MKERIGRTDNLKFRNCMFCWCMLQSQETKNGGERTVPWIIFPVVIKKKLRQKQIKNERVCGDI